VITFATDLPLEVGRSSGIAGQLRMRLSLGRAAGAGRGTVKS
jgi:hypothetical protein